MTGKDSLTVHISFSYSWREDCRGNIFGRPDLFAVALQPFARPGADGVPGSSFAGVPATWAVLGKYAGLFHLVVARACVTRGGVRMIMVGRGRDLLFPLCWCRCGSGLATAHSEVGAFVRPTSPLSEPWLDCDAGLAALAVVAAERRVDGHGAVSKPNLVGRPDHKPPWAIGGAGGSYPLVGGSAFVWGCGSGPPAQ